MATKTTKETTAPAPSIPETPAPSIPAPSLLDRFTSAVVLDPVTPMVDRENFRLGTLVRYLKGEKIPGERTWTKHHFLAHDDRRFGIGGSAQLDQKLRMVRPNQVLFLRYLGQDAESTHQWDVRRLECTPAQLTALKDGELKGHLTAFESVLNASYEREEARQAEFRARRQGGQQPPPHDDEDYTGR